MQFNDKTLEEINEHDKENLQHMLQGGLVKEFYFPTLQRCSIFMGQCFNAAMTKLGVVIKPGMHEKMVDRLMKTHGVKVERRRYPEDFRKCPVCGGDGRKKDPSAFGKKAKPCRECAGAGQIRRDEMWRSGLYIYKANEIAAFIATPTTWKKEGIIIRPGLPTFNRGFKILTTVTP